MRDYRLLNLILLSSFIAGCGQVTGVDDELDIKTNEAQSDIISELNVETEEDWKSIYYDYLSAPDSYMGGIIFIMGFRLLQ